MVLLVLETTLTGPTAELPSDEQALLTRVSSLNKQDRLRSRVVASLYSFSAGEHRHQRGPQPQGARHMVQAHRRLPRPRRYRGYEVYSTRRDTIAVLSQKPHPDQPPTSASSVIEAELTNELAQPVPLEPGPIALRVTSKSWAAPAGALLEAVIWHATDPPGKPSRGLRRASRRAGPCGAAISSSPSRAHRHHPVQAWPTSPYR
jgi:hypothetical protein